MAKVMREALAKNRSVAPMSTPIRRVIEIDPNQPDERLLQEAGALLRGGKIVAFPTETVYGLGADALNSAAVSAVYRAKGRPATNPVIVHVDTLEMARELTASWPQTADRLATACWPGPLTLVLPRASKVPDVVTAGGPTVAVRMPANLVALGLIRAAGVPVAAPSANRSGGLSPTLARHVLASLLGPIDLLIDAGPTQLGLESTVIDLTTAPPRILRPGQITSSDIERHIGPVQYASLGGHEPLRSPGLLPRHYAPRSPAECLPLSDMVRRADELVGAGLRVGCLYCGAVPPGMANCFTSVVLPAVAAGYAEGLYAALHHLDELQVDRILIVSPPQGEEWHAVQDRLRRAVAL